MTPEQIQLALAGLSAAVNAVQALGQMLQTAAAEPTAEQQAELRKLLDQTHATLQALLGG